MNGIWTWAGRALGGAGLLALVLLGTGCRCANGECGTSSKSGWTPGDLFAPAPPQPAVQMVAAFMQQVQYLPDPTRDGVNGAGITGQVFLMGKDGRYVQSNGDLVVMLEDTTPRSGGQPSPLVPEVFHFDAATLKKLKTNDERFGDCYAVFLPYPKEWKDKEVTTVRATAKYIPTGEKTLALNSSSQIVSLDFSTPGTRPTITEKSETMAGGKPAGVTETRGIPDIGVALAAARGKQPGPVQAGGVPPKSKVVNAGGVPPGTTVSRGPSGEKVTTTAVALPTDHPLTQTVNPANAWIKDPITGALRPNLAPIPAGPAMPTGPSMTVPAPLPPISVAPPLPSFNVIPVPTTQPTDPTVPAIPIPPPPGAISGAAVPPPNFDPTSPAGAWATPPIPTVPAGGLTTYTVPGRGN